MEQPQAIYFPASHLQWITRAEASHGWFQIDSFLEWFPAAFGQSIQFVLAAAVPAGRMYASEGPLVKQPPYSFQLIAGQNEHTILRRPLDANQPTVLTDSSQPHSNIFESLNWTLSYAEAQRLQPEKLADWPAPLSSINLLLEWWHHGGLLRLQAPLRHWNYRPEPVGWQIETGPLFWPLDCLAFVEKPRSVGLTTAWIHANQNKRVTISGDRIPCYELEANLSLLALT